MSTRQPRVPRTGGSTCRRTTSPAQRHAAGMRAMAGGLGKAEASSALSLRIARHFNDLPYPDGAYPQSYPQSNLASAPDSLPHGLPHSDPPPCDRQAPPACQRRRHALRLSLCLKFLGDFLWTIWVKRDVICLLSSRICNRTVSRSLSSARFVWPRRVCRSCVGAVYITGAPYQFCGGSRLRKFRDNFNGSVFQLHVPSTVS